MDYAKTVKRLVRNNSDEEIVSFLLSLSGTRKYTTVGTLFAYLRSSPELQDRSVNIGKIFHDSLTEKDKQEALDYLRNNSDRIKKDS